MDEIVQQYDIEAKQRVDKARNLEFILFALLFAVLLLEGLLIFRPLAQNIKIIIKQISDSAQKLQFSNASLSKMNDLLVETKKELFDATEKRHQVELAKEKVRSSSLIEGQELERKRLARELHDGIGQMLTGIKLQTEHLKSSVANTEKGINTLSSLQNLVKDTIEETRIISFNLAPAALSDFGIVSALRILIEQHQKMTGIFMTFESNLKKTP